MADEYKLFGDTKQRKPDEERRDKRVPVYFNEREKRELERKAEAAGLDQSVFLRYLLMDAEIESKVDRDTRDAIQEAGALVKRLVRESEGNEEAIEDTLNALREAARKI